jgi:hypothetical protein
LRPESTTEGAVYMTDRLAEIKGRRLPCRPCDQGLEGDCTCLDWAEHAPADIDYLVGEVERLQRYEAMWQDCRGHRDQAERRARRLQETLQQVEAIICPEDEGL